MQEKSNKIIESVKPCSLAIIKSKFLNAQTPVISSQILNSFVFEIGILVI